MSRVLSVAGLLRFLLYAIGPDAFPAKAKHVGIVRVDGDPHPLGIGKAEGFDAGEVRYELPAICRSYEWFIDTEAMRVFREVNHGLGKCRRVT